MELLTRATGWYGGHSGYYEQVPRYLAAAGVETRVTSPVDRWPQRALGKLIAVAQGSPRRNQSLTWAEWVFRHRVRRSGAPGHVLAFEAHLPLFARGAAELKRTAVTVHYPPVMLEADARAALKRVAAVVVLYRRDLDFFAGLVGAERVRFARHGVDTDFFRPGEMAPSVTAPRLVYVGQFGRDTAQAARVIPRLLRQFPALRVDVVLGRREFRDAALLELESVERVEWHFGVPDEQLRAIYQAGTALLLPMRASGANNAIVEALASGLPIATNDVGGIRDYGGGDLFPVLRPDDDEGMMQLIEHWLTDETARRQVADAVRARAVNSLMWQQSAEDHVAAYRAFFG